MGLREDLIAAAEVAAREAKDADNEGRTALLGQAKTALEAAAMAEAGITPDALNGALNELTAELVEAGVFDEAQRLEPTEFVRALLRGVVGLRGTITTARRKADAFDALEAHVSGIAAEITRSADERHTPVDDPGRRLANRMLSGVETIKMQAGIPHQE